MTYHKNYVLKTATGGYDGHGQIVIRSEGDLEEAYALATRQPRFGKNLSILTLRLCYFVRDGKDATVSVQENIHRNNILSKTIVPARISASPADELKAMAVRIIEQQLVWNHYRGDVCDS